MCSKKCAPYFRGNTQFPIYFFSKIQNGGFFEDDVIFQILKKQSYSTKIQDIPKKFAKKNFQDGYFQNGVCTLFLCENMSCDRYFRSIVLIFGLSRYFLTFNHTKIIFRFLDYPYMELPYKILIN
jgi:hypothetical protein